MPITKQKVTPCLWFDTQAEEAANFYAAIFSDSKINKVSRYTKSGREVHGKEPGSVLTVEFELEGQSFTALNGGPHFKFNEAVSFQVMCDGQDEIDLFLAKARRRRARRAVRVAQGQVRPVLADRTESFAANADRSRQRET
jgi:predicted 3-demethylubiquinone-9 3-methyltransferase (glyoxalase superfamily)